MLDAGQAGCRELDRDEVDLVTEVLGLQDGQAAVVPAADDGEVEQRDGVGPGQAEHGGHDRRRDAGLVEGERDELDGAVGRFHAIPPGDCGG